MKARVILPEELTETAINLLKEKLLQEIGTDVTLILFFGSRQRGEFTPDSDIDILIVIKQKSSSRINRIFEIADHIESSVLSYKLPFSIHIQSEDEYIRFKKFRSPFLMEIKKEGRVIYERTA
ncbi:MAG: nucleotidyltransferase domain-containing protein [Nitrospira sp.]|nr:nucleotidyltransferase domain-containing protein [Nitrospira sp.]